MVDNGRTTTGEHEGLAASPGVAWSGRTAGLDLGALFLVPGAAFLLFVAVPLGALVYRALAGGDLVEQVRSPLVAEALRLSLVTSTLTLMVVMLLGTPLAYGLARASFPGRRLVDTLIDLPLVLPPVVAGVALLMAFGRRGVLGNELGTLGIELAFSTPAVVVAQVFVSAPFYIRAARAGFQQVDSTLEGIAYTLGASRWSAFRRVALPLARPALLGGAVLCWARALSEFGATLLFAGNFQGRTRTLPLAILTALESDLAAALVIAVVRLVAATVVLVLFRLVNRGANV